ncbi:pyridoxal-phosphate dependent enzyme, partial [Butyricicoccus sp. 1XD8-22]
NKYTFSMVNQYVDQSVLVNEETIKKGMAYLYKEHKIVVEGAAAVGIGAIIDNIISLKENTKNVVIISGNNVDLTSHLNAIKAYI